MASAAQGHRDAELNEPRDLSTQRLAEIAFECLNVHGASLRPGARRWQRNGITAVMDLRRRVDAAHAEGLMDAAEAMTGRG